MHRKYINFRLQKELLSKGGLDVSLVLLPQLLWSFAAHCKVTRGGEERGSLWLGRGTLRTNWDPDVMADNINPCCGWNFFFLFFSQEGGSRGEDGKGDGILASSGGRGPGRKDVPGQEWLSCQL